MNNNENNNIRLEDLELPSDLKKLDIGQCRQLCRQIRRILVRTVSENGGHLASNLGTVELTMSLHRVFDTPDDKIVWDVGHQAYTHKLLTGRLSEFGTIRRENGLSGFVRPSESEHDAFISGHSSTSVSAACGIARAMKLNGDNEHSVVAVMGDGAFTGGEAYEGLNNASKDLDNLIIVLNNNEMSISKNVGAVAKYLTSIRGREKYISTKQRTAELLEKIPVVGKPVIDAVQLSKSMLKWFLYHSTMFEDLGFVYLGPVDGHDIAALDEVFRAAKKIQAPVFIHVNTVKGKGFRPAEKNPGAFHGVSAYDLKYGNPEVITDDSFSAVFGREITAMADSDERICAVTAAMKYGTGLQYFAADHPDRFFDVGIAEQHAVTFCGGLASMGKLPVFSVYSSFLQRAYDQVIHDIAISGEHIVLAVDRAGIVGEDGETHQGIFDVPMLTSIPNVTVYSPSDYAELKKCLHKAVYDTECAAVVRYPRGKGSVGDEKAEYSDCIFTDNGSGTLAVTYGRIYENIRGNKNADILKLVKIQPLSENIYDICMKHKKIVIFEEALKKGSVGEHIAAELAERGFDGRIYIRAIGDFVKQASVDSALSALGLDSSGMNGLIDSLKGK